MSAVSESERLGSETSDGVSRDRIMISTENPVRGLRVLAAGMDVSNYRKNPVVGYNHAMGNGIFGIGDSLIIPLARTVELTPHPGRGMEAEFEWPRWGEVEEIDKFHKLWDMRFLHAASIWFRADVIEETKNPSGEVVDRVAKQTTLREWSIVYVPADPNAVREARSIFRSLISPEMFRRDLQKAKRLRDFDDDFESVPKLQTFRLPGYKPFIEPLRDSSSKVEELQRAEEKTTVVPVEIDLSGLENSVNKLLESFQWQSK